jgi:chromosome partitioning protein
MAAKIIVISNQKGGPGKTTITMNLGASLAKLFKDRVLIIEGDLQASASGWASAADEDKPFPCPVFSLASMHNKAHTEIKKYIHLYDYILIDCPPSVSSGFTASALSVANLALVAIIPSPVDIRASIPFEKLIQNIQGAINENLKSVFVINQVRYGESLGKDVIQALEDFEIKPLKTQLSLRTSYRHAALGSSVLEGKDEKAKSEITRLTKEVLELLNN